MSSKDGESLESLLGELKRTTFLNGLRNGVSFIFWNCRDFKPHLVQARVGQSNLRFLFVLFYLWDIPHCSICQIHLKAKGHQPFSSPVIEALSA
mmetsp:Transcript_16325/g.29483  ORF Transcript_16325/g.29483 Transcript_16325/m.29483 type:complete len:94 (-) Transcript_16325:188-469(-)